MLTSVFRNYLSQHGFAGSLQGEITTLCPSCQHPSRKFYYSDSKGVGHCKHCNASGTPEFLLGSSTPEPSYFQPEPAERNYLTEAYIQESVANLFASQGKAGLSYLMVERGLRPDTIKEFSLGYDPTRHAVVIPRYTERGKLIGVKFRMLSPEAPSKYLYAKGSQASLFNLKALSTPSPLKAVILAEGEFDALAIHQLSSSIPVLATPGMSVFKEPWAKLFDDYRVIFLAFDNEPAADERAIEVAKKLREWRCYRIKLPDKVKDLNDFCLVHKDKAAEEWAKLLKEARCIGTPLVKDTKEYTDEAVEAYMNTDAKTVSTGYPALDDVMGGFAPGRVYLVKGSTKLGKTTFLLDLLINVARAGHKVLIGSFEMKVAQEMLLKVVSKLLGRDVVPIPGQTPPLTPTQLKKAIETIDSWGTIAWINRHDRCKLAELYDAVKIKYEEGFRFLLLDHAQFLMDLGSSQEGAVFTQTAKVSRFIKRLTNDFPDLTILAITELNAQEQTFGGKSLEYDVDVVLKYYGTGLQVEAHRLNSKYRDQSVQIHWNQEQYKYSVWHTRPGESASNQTES